MTQYYLLNSDLQALFVAMTEEEVKRRAEKEPNAVYIGKRDISQSNITIIGKKAVIT